MTEQQAKVLQRAVDVYRGELLEGCYEDWCVYERERLKTMYLALLEKLLIDCQQRGRVGEGVSYRQRILRLTRGFRAGNRILLGGGTSLEERHDLADAVHDPDATSPRTTLRLDPGDPVAGTFAAGVGAVSPTAPVFVEVPAELHPPVSPAIHVTSLGIREDPQRTAYVPQHDSFRRRGTVTVCSVRPGARAYLADYQIMAVAPDRRQQGAVYETVLRRLSADTGLRIDGVRAPIWLLPMPSLTGLQLGDLAPVYVRIGTRMQVAARR